MNKFIVTKVMPAIFSIAFLAACIDSSNEEKINLVFVVSPDIVYQTANEKIYQKVTNAMERRYWGR